MNRVPVGSVAVVAMLGAAVLGHYCFPYHAFDPDTAAYLFEARLMAGGAVAAEAPPDFGFSPSPHINIHNDLWYAKYPFGTSLFLTPGVLLGLPWLMPVLATGLTLLLFYAIIVELFDRRVAAVALLFALLSPTTLLIGGSLLSQPVSKLAVALYLYCILRLTKDVHRWERLVLALAAGLALGYAFNTRPLAAVVFGVAGTGFLLFRIARGHDRAGFAMPFLAMAGAGLIMLGLFLGWNAWLTGDPWLFTYHALQRSDAMGFGLRGEGYAPYIADFRLDFTPAYAFGRMLRHTLPAVFFTAMGWGAYDPSMFFPQDPRHRMPSLAPLLAVPAVLSVLPLGHRSRSASDLFCASIVLLTLFALFFQYSDHATWGTTPLNTSYYNEATLFGLIPLIARGTLICFDAAPRWLGRRWAVPVMTAASVLLVVNSIATNLRHARQLRKWDPYYQTLPRLVAEADLRHAVVFLPRSRNAPVGDYPFTDLAAADIVFFRLGPLPQWGLLETDWRNPYAKYFQGRDAYAFDGTALHRLDVEMP